MTVIDESAARADALATALLVLGPEAGFEFALQHELAASFLSRETDGITRRSTAEFDSYVTARETD